MKKIIVLLVALLVSISSYAQFSSDNSIIRKAIVAYELDRDGYYRRVSDKMLDRVVDIEINYAYDKKAQNMYILTKKGNCVVTLNKDYAKIIKKNTTIPQLKNEELDAAIQKYTKQLDDKYAALNEARAKHIQDSIAKAKADSIEAERQKATRLAKLKKQHYDYVNSHGWHWVPIGNISLYCTECEKSFSDDSLLTIGVKNDSIYYFTRIEGSLGLSYLECHKSQLASELKEYSPFRNHYEIYKDSLTRDSVDYDLIRDGLSYNYINDYIRALKKKAPYGFFKSWGWNDEYSCLSFNFNYMNTNAKTIKYIDVYFRVTNGVCDVRKTGHFQGTGPLAEFESASWEWDTSGYYVAGDASEMNITKVILTFINGTKKVLTGNLLVFE